MKKALFTVLAILIFINTFINTQEEWDGSPVFTDEEFAEWFRGMLCNKWRIYGRTRVRELIFANYMRNYMNNALVETDTYTTTDLPIRFRRIDDVLHTGLSFCYEDIYAKQVRTTSQQMHSMYDLVYYLQQLSATRDLREYTYTSHVVAYFLNKATVLYYSEADQFGDENVQDYYIPNVEIVYQQVVKTNNTYYIVITIYYVSASNVYGYIGIYLTQPGCITLYFTTSDFINKFEHAIYYRDEHEQVEYKYVLSEKQAHVITPRVDQSVEDKLFNVKYEYIKLLYVENKRIYEAKLETEKIRSFGAYEYGITYVNYIVEIIAYRTYTDDYFIYMIDDDEGNTVYYEGIVYIEIYKNKLCMKSSDGSWINYTGRIDFIQIYTNTQPTFQIIPIPMIPPMPPANWWDLPGWFGYLGSMMGYAVDFIKNSFAWFGSMIVFAVNTLTTLAPILGAMFMFIFVAILLYDPMHLPDFFIYLYEILRKLVELAVKLIMAIVHAILKLIDVITGPAS